MSSTPSSSSSPDAERARAMRLAKLFDLRTFIGTLFLIFGVVVTIEGLIVTDENLAKAADINISLWTGLVMIALGAFFVGWMLVKPPDLDVKHDDLGAPPEQQHH